MNTLAQASRATAFNALDRMLRQRVLRQLQALRGRQVVLVDALGSERAGEDVAGAAPLRIDVHAPGFYRALAANGSVGAAESYICLLYTSRCV